MNNLDSYLSLSKGEAPHNAVNKINASASKITITVHLRGSEA